MESDILSILGTLRPPMVEGEVENQMENTMENGTESTTRSCI